MFKLFLFVAFVVAETTKNNAYCATFSNEKCTACISNDYILVGDECFYKTEKNCEKVFEDGKKCKWCLDGYKMNEDGTCISGDETCPTRGYVEKTGDTTKVECKKEGCADDEQFIVDKCEKCTAIEYCDEYEKVDNGCKCTKCVGGAKFNADNTKCEIYNNLCNANDDTDPTKCSQCSAGYYLDGEECKEGAIAGCAYYKNKDECSLCMDKELPINGKCVCDESCSSCTEPENAAKCTSCKDENKIVNGEGEGTCVSPIANCDIHEYGAELKCTECADGYYLANQGKECKECNSACATCDEDGADKCTSCKEGKTLAGEEKGKCHNVIPGCATHDLDTDGETVKCLACDYGYYKDESTGVVQCKECDGSCATCTGAGNTKCTSCKDENKMVNVDLTSGQIEGTCVNKIDNCQVYTYGAEFKCQTCFDGYYLADEGAKCKKCHDACDTCSGEGDTKCYECNDGYTDGQPVERRKREGEKKCYPVIPGCQVHEVVSNELKCKECSYGYYDSDESDAVVCTECHEACDECTGAGNTKCLTCANYNGYYEEETPASTRKREGEKKCIKGMEGCVTHVEGSNYAKCEECGSGYYLTKDYKCTEGSRPDFNDAECYQFKADGTCGICLEDKEGTKYRLSNGECFDESINYCVDPTVDGKKCLLCSENEVYNWPENGKCPNSTESGSFGIFVAFFVAVIMVLF